MRCQADAADKQPSYDCFIESRQQQLVHINPDMIKNAQKPFVKGPLLLGAQGTGQISADVTLRRQDMSPHVEHVQCWHDSYSTHVNTYLQLHVTSVFRMLPEIACYQIDVLWQQSRLAQLQLRQLMRCPKKVDDSDLLSSCSLSCCRYSCFSLWLLFTHTAAGLLLGAHLASTNACYLSNTQSAFVLLPRITQLPNNIKVLCCNELPTP